MVEEIEDHAPENAFIIRVATAYLVVPHDHAGGKPDLGLAQKLKTALLADARVIDVEAPTMDLGWSPQFLLYPAVESSDDDHGVIDAQRHFHAQLFSEPIAFRVHAPKKNQLKVFQDDEIPTEDYYALWNGQSLLVAWELDADTPFSTSGGHVVRDVLEDATERAGVSVYIQACNPQCNFTFVHTDVYLTLDEDATDWSDTWDPEAPGVVYAEAPGPGDLKAAADRAWRAYRSALRDFADLKNIGRQILDLERVLRADLDTLNTLHYRRAQAAQAGWTARLSALWSLRSWRRKSRYYLSRLWLGLGSLEHLRRRWFDRKSEFDNSTAGGDRRSLFRLDSEDEIASIEDLDLTLIEAAIEHAGSRLDTGALATATFGGALAGAVAAVLVTLIH
jgi:hypothetical protein